MERGILYEENHRCIIQCILNIAILWLNYETSKKYVLVKFPKFAQLQVMCQNLRCHPFSSAVSGIFLENLGRAII